MSADDFQFDVRANTDGFRERELPQAPNAGQDILFIGDSFFFGHGVNREHRFSEQLTLLSEKRGWEDYRVWNLAHVGSGTLEEIKALRSFHERFSQPHVFLGFFVGNDFQDNIGKINRKMEVSNRDETPQAQVNEGQFFRTALRESRLFSVVKNSLWSIQGFQQLFNKLEMKNDRIAIYETKSSTWQNTLYEHTEKVLLELIATCDTNGVKLTLVLIPDHLQILQPEVFESYDLLKPQRWLKQILSDHEIPFIDLYETFRDEKDPNHLMFEQDKHWNAQGHAIVAEAIADYLAEHRQLLVVEDLHQRQSDEGRDTLDQSDLRRNQRTPL